MSYTIFYNGLIVTMDSKRRILENHALVVENDRIIEIKPLETIKEKYPAQAQWVDCTNKMILPGLIDVHAHAGHTMFTMLGYAALSNWMPMMTHIYHHNTTDEFWLKEGRLAALTRLKYGVTCGLSVLTNCQRSDNPAIGINHSQGYADIGLREIIAVGPSNPPFPRKTTCILPDGTRIKKNFTFDQLMQGAEDTISAVNHSHNGLIRGFIAPFVLVTSVEGSGPTAPDLAVKLTDHDRYMMRCIREVAKSQKTRIHTEAFGGMIRMAANDPNALLGSDVHLQHCTGISLDEARILAQSGTHVSSTPGAGQFMKRCPVPEMMEMGANVAISTDGTAPNATFDLVEMARKTQLVHQGALKDRYYFPPGKLLEMITIDAAKAIGWDHEIGSLEVGKKADIITVDLNAPHLTPKVMPIHKWILMGSGKDVDQVMVNGKFVMQNRKTLLFDENTIMTEAEKESAETLKRANMEKHLQPCDTFFGSTRIYVNESRF